MAKGLSLILALWLALTGLGASLPGEQKGVSRETVRIQMADGWESVGELTYPGTGKGPWPTVLLFHGSGPMDMDATNAPLGEVRSANFKLLAERLPAEGFAVLRFHKRGVLGLGKYDFAQVMQATTNQLIQDAGQVIATAKALPQVDGERLYLYGWSQGAQVATHAALAAPEVAGVILQGPPNSGWPEILAYQHLTLSLPLLKGLDQDGDGRLQVGDWFGVPEGPAFLIGSFYVWAPDSTPIKPKLRPDLDRNGDGLVDLEGELRPAMQALIQNPAVNPMMSPAHEPAESIGAVLPRLQRPVLILHGEQDGWVPVTDGEAIAAAAPDHATLVRLPGLGHALSRTEQPAADGFGVMEEQAIQALITWLKGR